MKQRIVLLGPPASGKGTQAELMQARYQFPTASPGAILREELKLGTALGREAEKATSQGQLVSDSVANAVIDSWLSRQGDTFIFDGYPRSLGQAEALDAMLTERNLPLDAVISLEADRETIRQRVERRMMCIQCGRIVSIGLHVAAATSPCPSCGGSLAKRLDDNAETLELRLQEYAAKTEPLIAYYSERGLLRPVDSTRTPEVVFGSIVEILEKP